MKITVHQLAPPINTAHPPCLSCGGGVPPRPGETHSKWMRRSFCSLACRGEYSNRARRAAAAELSEALEAEHAPCVVCEQPVRHRKGEDALKYARRATCGQERCYRHHHKAQAQARAADEAAERKIDWEMRAAATEAEAAGARGEVDYGKGFWSQNITPPPSDSFGRLPGKPLATSFGVSSNWAVAGR